MIVRSNVSERVEEISAAEPEPAASIEYLHLRRNFFLGVFNGAMFSFAESLLSVDTVLTWFVQQLGGSNFLIGLVGPMRDAGWFLPQLFVSKWQERHSLKMPLYRKVTVVRTLAWLTWTVLILTSKDLTKIMALLEKKESLTTRIAALDTELSAFGGDEPAPVAMSTCYAK